MGDYQWERGYREGEMGQGVNCMVTDGNSTFGGEHNAGAIL